ncbi:DegV domain-containing protein [Gammaproteobacteria bacterium]|nr:DegV domain-containing protein [Gammaproteobacteria bacterium]
MTIKIVTDSTCDLPQSIIDEFGITVIPLFVNFGGQGYRDGVDLSRAEFYARLPQSDPLPTTAAPGHEVFKQAYDRLAAEGASEVLSIHISESLSATFSVAKVAAQETTSVRVTALDSRQLSLGTGFIVEEAAKAAHEGCSMAEIITRVNALIPRVHVFAALDTMEFLKRSGRISGIVAGLGGLLQVKPILKMHDGKADSDRVRTRSRAIGQLVNLLSQCSPLERVAMVHTHAAGRAEEVRQLVEPMLPEKSIWSLDITPVIGTHIGPGAVGFACVSKKK